MKLDYTHLKELVNRGPKNLDSDADGNSPPPVRSCELHPLIHTLPPKSSTQDLEKKKAEPRTPHFLSLNQNIVAWSQEEKCGLKYVIYTFRRPVRTLYFNDINAPVRRKSFCRK